MKPQELIDEANRVVAAGNFAADIGAPQYRDLISRLAGALASAEADADMYDRAWTRELGGRLFPKTHKIDALVKTTRHLRENYKSWAAETKAIREYRKTCQLAATLGVPAPAFREDLPSSALERVES